MAGTRGHSPEGQAALERPVVAVDVVMLRAVQGRLEVLLARRTSPPFRDIWALPGAAVRLNETLEQTAYRALMEKTGWGAEVLREAHVEQLATFDALFRDPRGRTISVAHLGLCLPGTPAVEGRWQAVEEVPSGCLPFDHDAILALAVQRLRSKLRYSGIASKLLEAPFRIEALRAIYESILGRPLNRSNFRNKLLSIGLIERVGIAPSAAGSRGGRPPHLYRFTRLSLLEDARDFL